MVVCTLGMPIGACAAISCTATVTGIAFGTYDSLNSASDDSVGNVAVTCTATAPSTVSYTIAIGGGSGGPASRHLTSDQDSLTYNLYTDATRVQLWGDGTAGTSVTSDSYSLSQTQVTRTYGIYGRIPGKQSRRAGSYRDVLAVTVTY